VRRLFLVAVVILSITGYSYAATKEELAKEIVKLTDISKMTNSVITQVMHQQADQLKAVNIPADHQKDEAALRDKIRVKLEENVSWAKLEPEYTKFLIEVYTEEELKAILNFCSSPVGKEILKKEPILMGKIMVMTQARVQSVYPEIQKMTRDFTESVKRIK